jgi:hypothetical protein
MKYIFRGHTIFEYLPITKQVIQHKVGPTAAFDFCHYIPEDYKLFAIFFDIIYRHIQGEQVELQDINVS